MSIEELAYSLGAILSMLLLLMSALITAAQTIVNEPPSAAPFCILSLFALHYFSDRLEHLKGKQP